MTKNIQKSNKEKRKISKFKIFEKETDVLGRQESNYNCIVLCFFFFSCFKISLFLFLSFFFDRFSLCYHFSFAFHHLLFFFFSFLLFIFPDHTKTRDNLKIQFWGKA